MNYLAHGHCYLEQPYVLAGTAIPDWLSVVDRGVRIRPRHLTLPQAAATPQASALAEGVRHHHRDDNWFHGTRAFAELTLEFTVLLRDNLPPSDGFRASFLGHVLVEVILDDVLAQRITSLRERYYAALETVDVRSVVEFVETVTAKSAAGLGPFIRRFLDVRFLYDYAEDAKLLFRMNQVMQRVGLAEIPAGAVELFPQVRSAVARRFSELLPRDGAEHDQPPNFGLISKY